MKLNWQKLSVREGVILFAMGVCACLCLNMAIAFFELIRIFPGASEAVEKPFLPPLWQQILLMVVVMPAVEELAFRGLVFQVLRKHSSFWASALLSAACFGLYHGNMLQAVYGFFVGLLLAWLLERSGRIFVPIWVHAAANLTSIGATFLGVSAFAGAKGIQAFGAVFFGAGLWLSVLWYRRYLAKNVS